MTTHENCDELRTENKRLREEIVRLRMLVFRGDHDKVAVALLTCQNIFEGIAREHYFKHDDKEANRYRQYLDMVREVLDGYLPEEKTK